MAEVIKSVLRFLIYFIISLFVLYVIGAYCYDDYPQDIGGGYYFDTGGYIWGNNITIPEYVSNLNYNDRFIIAKQKLYGLHPGAEYKSYDYPSLRGDYYWIIDKYLGLVYGPLDIDDFEKKCKELDVSIELDPEQETKPRVRLHPMHEL